MDRNPGTSPSPPPIGARVVKGAAWVAGSRFIVRLVGLANTLILARLLVPADFGIVALGVTVTQLLQNISDIGVSHTVIRFRDASRGHLDTLFTLSAIRGVIIAGLLLVSAPIAGQFYDDPRVGHIFTAMSGVAFLQAMINPKFFEFERELDFRREFIAAISAKAVSVITAITIAYFYQSYWAIVVGILAGTIVQLGLSYVLRPFRPKITLSAFRELIGFTGWLTGVSCMVALNNKTEPLFLGRLLGAGPTGTYYLGDQLSSMPSMEIAIPAAKAIYPGLNTLQADPARMRMAFLRGAEAMALIAIPAAFGIAFVAQDFVRVVLGSQWGAAVPVIQILAPIYGLIAVYFSMQALAMAHGRTRAVFIRELIFFLIKTPLFLWATIAYGLNGAVAGAAIGGIAYVILQGLLYRSLSGDAPWQPLWQSRRSLAGAAAMAIWFFVARPVTAIPDFLPFLRLGTDIVIGGLIYCLAIASLWNMSGRPAGPEQMALDLFLKVRPRTSHKGG